jgi:hypothetical protein
VDECGVCVAVGGGHVDPAGVGVRPVQQLARPVHRDAPGGGTLGDLQQKQPSATGFCGVVIDRGLWIEAVDQTNLYRQRFCVLRMMEIIDSGLLPNKSLSTWFYDTDVRTIL